MVDPDSDLAVDGRRLLGRRAGVARYLASLLQEWSSGAGSFGRVHVYTPQPLSEPWLSNSTVLRNVVLRGPPVGFFWENTSLRAAARRNSVLFCPSQRIPGAYPGRVVVTIFGVLSSLQLLRPTTGRYWQAWFHERLYRYAARRADLVITDSKRSRDEIVKAYAIPGDRIRVVPLAPAGQFRRIDDVERIEAARRKFLGSGHPFVLFVGTFSPRRNIPLLIDAFADAVARTRSGHRLVLVGRNAAGYDIRGLAAAAGAADTVIHPANVSDDDLVLLYNAATVVVHPAPNAPSLPVLEAMATGTPVIAVASTAVAETAGDAALLIPDATRKALAEALERIMTDEPFRSALALCGARVAARYSWRRTAAETLDILAEVGGR